MIGGSARHARLIRAALEWQDATDLVMASAPLGEGHPVKGPAVQRAVTAHMELLHAAREYRDWADEIPPWP